MLVSRTVYCISLCIMILNMIHRTPFHLSLIHNKSLHKFASWNTILLCLQILWFRNSDKKTKGHLAPATCYLEPQLGRLEYLKSPHGWVLESSEGLHNLHFSHLGWCDLKTMMVCQSSARKPYQVSRVPFLTAGWLRDNWTSCVSFQGSNIERFCDHEKKDGLFFII